jgi:hypothetical protein
MPELIQNTSYLGLLMSVLVVCFASGSVGDIDESNTQIARDRTTEEDEIQAPEPACF